MPRKKLDSITDISGPNIGNWVQTLVNAVNEYLQHNFVGTGTPEGVVIAPIGSTFRRTDGGSGTTLYVKESGTGNTGWVGK